jgi:cytochrome c oxidase subunit 3
MTEAAHTHTHADPETLMGLPLTNGKFAMWFFLITEIMFFTALIGTYLIIRNSIPNHDVIKWPTPHQVHLSEPIGAINTFVLIASSLTVVLAHYAAERGNFRNATLFIGATTALGLVFLIIKYTEYKAKYDHDILPGHVGELLPGMGLERERAMHPVGMQYVERIREQLAHAVEHGTGKEVAQVTDADVEGASEMTQRAWQLRKRLDPVQVGKDAKGETTYTPPLTPAQVGEEVNKLLHEQEEMVHKGELKKEELHLSPAIPYGNMWSSCYFAMTGFHALHVLGGIVIFVVILVVGLMGKLAAQHTSMLEIVGLYWHFVDIVWIFLFPLLYLV